MIWYSVQICIKLVTVYFFPVLCELIDTMAEKLQVSLGVEEFSSLCAPTQVSLLFLKSAASICCLQAHNTVYMYLRNFVSTSQQITQ